MKQLLSFIVCCLIGASSAAQDIILKRNAEQIEAIVKEITDTDVKYRKFTNTEGVTYSIRRSEVFSITYETAPWIFSQMKTAGCRRELSLPTRFPQLFARRAVR